MRDTNFSPQKFCCDLSEFLAVNLPRIDSEVLSLITPSASTKFENDFVLKTRKKDDLIVLAIASWYVEPSWIGMLLRLSLQEKITNNEDLFEINFYLQSKAEMLIFLQETSLYHTRDFYGNLLTKNRLRRFWSLFSPLMKTARRPKRVQRHRGYRDKGTLKQQWEVHEAGNYRKEQLEIEAERQALDDSYNFCRGFLYGG